MLVADTVKWIYVIPALLAAITGWFLYLRAKTELKTARLKESEARKLTLHDIREVFQRCQCPGSSVCVEVVCLPFYKAVEDATSGVYKLSHTLQDPACNAVPVIWIQEQLARLVTGPRTSLDPPAI